MKYHIARQLIFLPAFLMLEGCLQEFPTNYSQKKSVSPSSCLVGYWERGICNGNKTRTLEFKSDGTGTYKDYDCTSQNCIRTFPFSYVDNGSNFTLTYKQGSICGTPATPTGGNQSYTCSTNTITIIGSNGNEVYSRK